MKTSTVEVGELVSSLSAAGVQRRIAALAGVHHVDVNYVAGSATVHYDETVTSLDDIRRRIIECGYHCRGEMLPAHVCPPQGHAEVAALSMSGSSAIVAINALLLKRTRLAGIRSPHTAPAAPPPLAKGAPA